MRALRTRGYRRDNTMEQIAMRNRSKKFVFRLKKSCLVKCYGLWSVGLFLMILLKFSRSILTCTRCRLT